MREIVNKPKEKEPHWVSAHLFYAGDWKNFLVNCVSPLIEHLKKQGVIDKYFFIRYGERGPHIRLRILTSNPDLVMERVNKEVGDYYSQYPSKRVDYERTMQVDEDWLPNNSVQWIAYQPEVERYGGPQAINFAERQFEASTQAVLTSLKANASWTQEVSLGTAMKMHLCFAHALGMNRLRAGDFFKEVFMYWLPKAYIIPGHNNDLKVLSERRVGVMQAFQKTYAAQQSQLKEWVHELWEVLEEGLEEEEGWLYDWYQHIKVLGQELKALEIQGLLEPSNLHTFEGSRWVETPVRWGIYDSYVHMTNNRLGVLNRDEGYLGFLLYNILHTLE